MLYHFGEMKTLAMVNPKVLTWARKRVRLTTFDIAKKVTTNLDLVEAWEAGTKKPTFRQAQKIADATHVPFGYLFLPDPPEEPLPLPDFRSVSGTIPPEPSVDLLETVKSVLFRQAWYVDYLKKNYEAPLPFIGSFSLKNTPEEIASAIKRTLALSEDTRSPDPETYLRALIEAAERNGILVMRSGIVGTITHRKLDVSEFRGFVVIDPLAPVVFINGTDAPAARVFTLIHELAHIWIGSSGISDPTPTTTRQEEVLCNTVAGEFLVPKAKMLNLWDKNLPLSENFQTLSRQFHVSRFVVIRRAVDLNLITKSEYQEYYQAELDQFRRKESSGGSFYNSVGSRNSLRFTKAVLAEALSNRLLLRDAGKLLGVQPANIKTYAESVLK